MTANDTRNTALQILREVFTSGKFIQDAFRDADPESKGASALDRRFIQNLVRGTAERKTALEAVLTKLSRTPLSKVKPVLKILLLQGLYELLFTNVKAYAAVNEYVTLARRKGFQGLSGFVNAILRRAAREKEALLQDLSEEEAACLPENVLSLVGEDIGRENALAFGRYVLTDTAKQLTIRRNISKCTSERFITLLQEDGAEAVPLAGPPFPDDEIFVLRSERPVTDLTAFQEGLFYVQDISSWYAFRGLSSVLRPKTAVLDLCAAPGGKTFLLMDLAAFTGFETRFTACDISEKRVHKLLRNADRMGFSELETRILDASMYHERFSGSFDLVLADVPCSGIGDLAGKPEIRLHADETSVSELAALQKQILEQAASYVRKGGVLQYSTCTLTRPENDGQILHFLSEHPEFELIEEKTLISGVNTPGDGFYYARMRKCL